MRVRSEAGSGAPSAGQAGQAAHGRAARGVRGPVGRAARERAAARGQAAATGGWRRAGGGVGTVDNGTQTRSPALTLADAQALQDPVQAPDVVSVAPVVNATAVTATDAGASHAVGTFNGTTPSYLVNDNDAVAAGAPFTQSDYDQHSRVALVGLTVATSLVGGDGTAIVGQTVQFNGIDYAVVGLLTSKGSTGPQDQDDRVIAPLTAVQDTLTGYGNLSSISVKAASAIGAQRGDIVGQFLLEAVLLSMFGGLLGVGIGVVVGSLKFGTFQLVVAPFSVVVAFLVSVAIGLFFGIYPANRAAALRPIDALRYE